MFWTEEKVKARILELAEYRYRDAVQIPSFRLQIDEQAIVGNRPPAEGDWTELRLGERWQGRDLYAWLTADIEIPAGWVGRKVVGRFNFGRTGGGNNSGFESLLYINGSPYQGVDANHQEVFLPQTVTDSSEGSTCEKLALAFRLWSGLEGGGWPAEQEHRLQRAEVAWLDETVDDLYYTGKAIIETVEVLEQNRPERQELLTILNRACLLIDWSRPGSDSFFRSVTVARDLLRNELKRLDKQHRVTVHCIGHTHIDVAWLWRLKHTREKAARSFSTVLRLMELYPEYMFLQTQPQLYEYLQADYPDIFAHIQRRVQEGRWEAAGGMWLEADCNLPSGESLVRQLLLGTKFLREQFGVACTYLWLPDVFGYSWALPQILQKSGISTFVTTKLSWNQYNRMPHDTFKWRGIDGSAVLTHFITTPEGNNFESSRYTYNGQITPATVEGIWAAYRDKPLNQDLLLSFGYGDGGGGPTREMLELRRRLSQMPGLPRVVTARADQFFARLHANVDNTDQYVHTWDGELYLEYHRGTYTSQAYNKRMNRKMELLYREAEWLSVVACVSGNSPRKGLAGYPQAQLAAGWKIILRNQFHDILPGSSIHEVYEDSRQEYAEAERIGREVWERAASSIAVSDSPFSFTVFNSSPFKRDDLVKIEAQPGMESGTWRNAKGEELPAQRSDDDGWLVHIPELPAMGYTTVRFDAAPHAVQSKTHSASTALAADTQPGRDFRAGKLVTPHYKIEWNAHGQLTRIYDRLAQREVLANGASGNVLQVFEDKPMQFEAWDIDIYYQEKMREVRNLKSVKVTEAGPLRAVVRFEWQYMDSVITQNMIVYKYSRRIDFATTVDWHEQHQLLKVSFPVAVRATEATYDIQFGNVKRPTHWNTSWEYARFETVAHQWADLSETGYGISLLNDCKYGHDIKDNVMRLSLIKSATYPDVKADQGYHEFTYSLLPHTDDWVAGQTVQEAWAMNNPLSYVRGEARQLEFSMFQVSADNIMVDAVKKAESEDKLIVRLHEFTGRRGPVEIRSQLQIGTWQESDLLERATGELSNGPVIQFFIKPYEIKTFLVEMSPKVLS